MDELKKKNMTNNDIVTQYFVWIYCQIHVIALSLILDNCKRQNIELTQYWMKQLRT